MQWTCRGLKKECSAMFLSYWPSPAPHLPIINSGQTFSSFGAKEKNNYWIKLREVINVNLFLKRNSLKAMEICLYLGNRQHLMNILYPICTDVFHRATYCVGAALFLFLYLQKNLLISYNLCNVLLLVVQRLHGHSIHPVSRAIAAETCSAATVGQSSREVHIRLQRGGLCRLRVNTQA